MPDLDKRELGTVLAALRFWQRSTDHHDRWHDEIASCSPEGSTSCDDGVSPLADEEIDALCERLNTQPDRFVAVAFDRETASYQGYENLSPAEKDLLVARAADMLGEMPSVLECIGIAFDTWAERLGYVSDDCLEQVAAERGDPS